jgi:hypothetical protein
MLYLMGRKSKWGPRLGLINQIAWLVYALMLGPQGVGLLPGVILYAVIHVMNIIKWERATP